VKALAAVGSNKLLIIVLFIYIIHIATKPLHEDKVGREVPLFSIHNCSFLWLQIDTTKLIKEYVDSVSSFRLRAKDNTYCDWTPCCMVPGVTG
jgi:hypothetical protein